MFDLSFLRSFTLNVRDYGLDELMFAWLKRQKRVAGDSNGQDAVRRLVKSGAHATAIAECVTDHFQRVRRGELPYPVHKDSSVGSVGVWNSLRFECMHQMFDFGAASLFDLSVPTKQNPILDRILSAPPSYVEVSPTNNSTVDTVNAIWRVYRYLDSVGSDVIDQQTDREELRRKNKTIFDEFLAEVKQAQLTWRAIDNQRLEFPEMILDILWRDVTIKTKSIGLSAVFGRSPSAGISNAENMMREKGASDADIAALRKVIECYRLAASPEEFHKNDQ
jgi:hypothetical protein